MPRNNLYHVLTYKEFQHKIVESLKSILDENYKIELCNILKNNSVELVAIVIKKEKEYLTPNIYLEGYYEHYLNGRSIEEILNNVIKSHSDFQERGKREINKVNFKWPNVRDGIFYRIINRDKNKRLLETVPHILYLDLAITFQYLASNNKDGIGMIRITKDHMQEWGINLRDLKELAEHNTPRLFPASVKNMNEVIYDMIKEECDDNPMYVVTNTHGINGATCMLYKDVLMQLAYELDSDLFILPSSIHEVIAIKDDGFISKADMIDMVAEVNEHEVGNEDYLSDQVYHYNRSNDMIIM